MRGVLNDLLYGPRNIRRRPTLAWGVVLTLGLGIGATTAIYSVVDGVLLRPLKYPDAGRLVAIGTTFPGREWEDEGQGLQHLAGTSFLNFQEFRARSRSFSSLGAAEQTNMLMTDLETGPDIIAARGPHRTSGRRCTHRCRWDGCSCPRNTAWPPSPYPS